MVELHSLQARLNVPSLPHPLFFSRVILSGVQPAIGWITLVVVLLFSSTAKAQSSVVPEATTAADAPISIPVETPPQNQPESVSGDSPEASPERTIQVPNIVPIPPRPIPTGPLAPLPESTSSEPAAPEDTYVLGSGDQIVVDVFNVPEFSGENGTYTILVDGSVSFPWIGPMRLQGLTLSQAATRLER
ncbi:MAG TPA: polysaccharide biosynthesis/export family protein, partial [Allocoleopsis sp.]